MKKNQHNAIIYLIIATFLFASCNKSEDPNPANASTKSDLELNSWSIDGKLFKLSAYGFGWASTDFSPRAGWQYYSNTDKSSVEISFLAKPVPSGKHTVENYRDVHLNKVRDNKITGNKVGITLSFNNNTYESLLGGEITVEIVKDKTNITFKDVVVSDIITKKTVKVSANLQYTNQ
jgi:hypothetical protein